MPAIFEINTVPHGPALDDAGFSLVLVRAMTNEVAESARSRDSSPGEGSGASSLPLQLAKGSDHASITIIQYTDLRCPRCLQAARILDEVIKTYPDEIRLIFKHFPSAIRPEAVLAHEASMAAAAQGRFWAMNELLMAHQGKLASGDFEKYADEIGLDKKRFSEALEDHRFKELIFHEMTEARGFGVTQAPTFFINGRKLVGARPLTAFKRIIDEELGITQTAIPPKIPLPPLIDLASIELDFNRTPIRGPKDAEVTIVEFSDFQCPFCAKATPTIQQLMKTYPGQIRWIFKHYPLPIHSDARLAHEVSLSAAAQGKFWEMHDLIFENQRAMKKEDLFGHARQLGLDIEQIENDLSSGKFKATINADMKEGKKLGIRGTPTFLINGRKVVGALPFQTFQGIIEQEINRPPS